jgi:hypothetical protein
MLDLSSINQRNPNSDRAEASPEYGVVHYLALTFSTLLSSQVSGAHRAGSFGPGLGQLIYIRSAATPSQIGVSPPESTRTQPGEPLEAPGEVVAIGFLRVGRRSVLLLRPAPREGLGDFTPPRPAGQWHRTRHQLRRILTAPTVRLPRRTMT